MKSSIRFRIVGFLSSLLAMSALMASFADDADRPLVLPPDRPVADQPTILDLIPQDERAPRPQQGLTANSRAAIRVHIQSSTGGTLVPLVGGAQAGNEKSITTSELSSSQNKVFTMPLALVEGHQVVVVAWKPTRDTTNETEAQFRLRHNPSPPFPITLDTTGPILRGVELVDVPNAGSTLLVRFRDSDFDRDTVKREAFLVHRQAATGDFGEPIPYRSEPAIDGNVVKLFLGRLSGGLYQLTVVGVGTAPLKDALGNVAGGLGNTGKNQTEVFATSGEDQPRGQHVEFPPFAPPKMQEIPPEGFNPDDFVETRVSRLYYYRDAHRVAQIINRNIRSYNQPAVTLAQRRAEDSRDAANEKTDERRQHEREAVRSAQQARAAEQQLQAAQETLGVAQELQSSINADGTRLEEIQRLLQTSNLTVSARTQLETEAEGIRSRIAANRANLGRFGDVTTLDTTVTTLQKSVASLRQTEIQSQDRAFQTEAAESRARERQFRDEVAAETADPNTYVPGKIESIDSVTQVSISVIGEGLIQLRGPIKGINKVRTMINQIDSPVGQVKIGIFTVQVNGEKGERMEKVVGDAEGYIDHARFLVNQSLELLRRSVQSEAALMAEQCEMGGHYQVDRDRRYLYSFFGRDFIDELYAMNSEFLFSENKLLSLHSMDTVSLNRALFILALAKNDVRERVVARFLESAKTELADAEFDFRRSSELKPHRSQKHFPPWNRSRLPVWNRTHKEEVIFEAVHRNAMQRYHFRNFRSFFDAGIMDPDTMNPMQREFIRLAQIFKARLVAEMELKQRVIERGLIEDRSNDEDALYAVLSSVRTKAYDKLREAYERVLETTANFERAQLALATVESQLAVLPDVSEINKRRDGLIAFTNNLSDKYKQIKGTGPEADAHRQLLTQHLYNQPVLLDLANWLESLGDPSWLGRSDRMILTDVRSELRNPDTTAPPDVTDYLAALDAIALGKASWEQLLPKLSAIRRTIISDDPSVQEFDTIEKTLSTQGRELQSTELGETVFNLLRQATSDVRTFSDARQRVESIQQFLTNTRAPLDHRKLLNHLIDEQEDKFIELVEGTRSHIAVMDSYLKRLSIALEDDFKTQFYDPAFVRIREAARAQQVTLGQIERTTILTNNRAFAKVEPQATMEFDLPKRQIAIKEAFDGALALIEDTGALINDPTFLAAFQMMGGSKQATTVQKLLPGQTTSSDQHNMGIVPHPQDQGTPGSALQSLVPDPAIFKLETGTGFQIRPVVQPDGDSVVYDFNYMYTTNIREPVRADEKHLGRVRRHFVHTEVQTGNFEMREISRYQVALKVARTSRGVPLLEDIPLLGAAFRPAPSAESSLQQNIILGQTNTYPTLFDLMGLRWAPHVVDLDHISLLESEHVVRGRHQSIRNYVFGEATRRVDGFLGIPDQSPDQYRPDLYYRQSLPSPHHPSGYSYPHAPQDPTGHAYERVDQRPLDMQDPPFDRFRHQPVHPERIGPYPTPNAIPLDSSRRRDHENTQEFRFERIRPDYQEEVRQAHFQANSGPASFDESLRELRREPRRIEHVIREGFESVPVPYDARELFRLPPIRATR